ERRGPRGGGGRGTAQPGEGRGADEEGGGDVREVAAGVVEALGDGVLGVVRGRGGRVGGGRTDGEGEGSGDGMAVGGYHPPGHRVGAVLEAAGQNGAGGVGGSVRVLRLAQVDAAVVGAVDTEGVVEQTDGLGEGQGDVPRGGLDDAVVLGVAVPEGGVGACGGGAAEEEQDQHGAQQHQPLKSPGSAAGCGPSRSAIARRLAPPSLHVVPASRPSGYGLRTDGGAVLLTGARGGAAGACRGGGDPRPGDGQVTDGPEPAPGAAASGPEAG